MSTVTEQQVYETALSILMKDKEGVYETLFEEIIHWEETNPPDPVTDSTYWGWEWYHVRGSWQTLNKLVRHRILDVVYKTNKAIVYKASNREGLKKALADYRRTILQEQVPKQVPPDLFDIIIGHEDKKEIIKRILDPSVKHLHALLLGVVATAKTMIMEELSRLPGSKLVIGSYTSRVGLFEVLYNERPDYLLIDEIDKIEDAKDLAILLSLMQTGYISETKHNRDRTARLPTKVFASANNLKGLPHELLSRFILLRFPEYTDDEFTDVVVNILKTREGLTESLALYISQKCLYELSTRDVRDAIKIARLLKEKSKSEVDYLVQILKKQK